MTHRLLWNQPFPPIQTSVRVNKRLALQQVGSRFIIGLLPLISLDLALGLEFFHTPLPAQRPQGHLLSAKPGDSLAPVYDSQHCVSLIGVAEQFAIAEAKLRAWSSVDGDDSTDDSYDEDFTGGIDTGEECLILPLGVNLPGRCDSL